MNEEGTEKYSKRANNGPRGSQGRSSSRPSTAGKQGGRRNRCKAQLRERSSSADVSPTVWLAKRRGGSGVD